MEHTKTYKPEISTCPLCGSQLKYRYTVSNKVIQFSNGNFVRVKNLGYSCKNPDCIDDTVIYCSQTASKLCIKGYTYSAKVLADIVVLKRKHKSREEICDYLAMQGIEMSDRNVDIINEKYEQMLKVNYLDNIKLEYDYMKKHYGQIRISIDSIRVEDARVLSVRDSFNNHQIGLHILEATQVDELKEILHHYVDDNALKAITTVRSFTDFFKILSEVVNKKVEYYYFEKF